MLSITHSWTPRTLSANWFSIFNLCVFFIWFKCKLFKFLFWNLEKCVFYTLSGDCWDIWREISNKYKCVVSVAVCAVAVFGICRSVDHGRSRQSQVQLGTARYNQVQWWKDPSCAIFSKSRRFEGIKYDTERSQVDHLGTTWGPLDAG